jgi:hypothetical protein
VRDHRQDQYDDSRYFNNNQDSERGADPTAELIVPLFHIAGHDIQIVLFFFC